MSIAASNQPRVEIFEVSPRDGLQNEAGLVSTADKLRLIERLAGIGARRIEVGSFVNPKRVPQMADTEEVIAGLPDRNTRSYRATGLCLNEKGVLRALAGRADGVSGIDEAGCVLVSTDTFGIRNQGQTVADGIAANARMIQLAKADGMRAQVTIAASFGCPFEGAVDPGHVIGLAMRMIDAGAEEIGLADTIGVAVPAQVEDVFGTLIARVGTDFPLRVHLHDTRGLGPANAWAAYRAGVRIFDASLGGLGGCPFAPKAAGNVATEDLAYLFDHSGVAHNMDLAAALSANDWFAGIMGRPLPSRVGRAGEFKTKPTKELESA
jgi:hydroxymethylglutaryl-CoA lyase